MIAAFWQPGHFYEKVLAQLRQTLSFTVWVFLPNPPKRWIKRITPFSTQTYDCRGFNTTILFHLLVHKESTGGVQGRPPQASLPPSHGSISISTDATSSAGGRKPSTYMRAFRTYSRYRPLLSSLRLPDSLNPPFRGVGQKYPRKECRLSQCPRVNGHFFIGRETDLPRLWCPSRIRAKPH